ncbi:ARID/BRIGHT DNA binding domain protein [Oesophagostomum dentatum]|uniref:ARID/BRIGHT DNA binding domain protein n=1 Tax=Oesophagostomum dentatum TaxID=61180 RepID=A0A0B1TD11_OESDE|nr:ARID/BRIGHT DNA binding domain protein [Oesophagostomum dentatum]
MIQDQNVPNGGTPFGADRYAATAAAVAAEGQPQAPAQQVPSQQIPQQQLPPHQPQPHPYAAAYPPQFMQNRAPGYPCYPGYPGLPAAQPGYPGAPVAYPPHLLRPQQPELVRMPQGPTPAEWAAQQQRAMKEANPSTPASMPAPSPAASSVADDSMDDKSRLESPNWVNQGQRTPLPPSAQTPVAPPSMHPGGPAGGMMMHPGMMPPQGMMPPVMQPTQASGPRKESIVDKLVGPPTAANPPRVMPERRMFFERLVQFCEQHGEPITMIPQVSKQNVDLHRLYIGVRNRGGFEQVTKDKAWKAICTEANPEISQSSAAGYQLRKHYEKHLLLLECVETGRRPEDAVAFADGLKRQRRKEPAASAAGATPNSSLPNFPG